MKKNPLITIIVPVFNQEDYLERCLDSILIQTFNNFECILVNDGSMDSSLDICRKYSLMDERIKTVNQKNGGPSSARNCGLRNVRSPWVTFVDADDYVTQDYLENYVKYLSEDNATQIIQGYYCYGYGGEEQDTLYPGTTYSYHTIVEGGNADYIESNNLLINWAVWCKIFSMEIIRNNNLQFEESLKCGEDGLFWHKYICFVKKIIFIPERGYIYFCPKNFHSISRGCFLAVDGAIALAENYKEISGILSKKFKLGKKSKKLLKMLYLNNYFRLLWKNSCLSLKQWKKLSSIRPPQFFFILSRRWIFYFILNLFPMTFIKLLKMNKANEGGLKNE